MALSEKTVSLKGAGRRRARVLEVLAVVEAAAFSSCRFA
jgi:hypothetical protein